MQLFLRILLGLSLSLICPICVPHFPSRSIVPTVSHVTRTSLFLHFDYLDQSCSSCHQTSSHIHFLNLCFYCYPDVCLSLTQPYLLVFPLHSFLPPPTFDFHFLPRHFTRHEHAHFSFFFLFPLLSIPPSSNLPSPLLPHVTRTIHNHPKPPFPLLLPTCSKHHYHPSSSILLPYTPLLPGHCLSRALVVSAILTSPLIFIFFLITSYGTNLASSPHTPLT